MAQRRIFFYIFHFKIPLFCLFSVGCEVQAISWVSVWKLSVCRKWESTFSFTWVTGIRYVKSYLGGCYMCPPAASSPSLTRGGREQRSDALHQCRRARWLHGAYRESGSGSMTWHRPRPERPWIPSARRGKHCYHSRNQLLYLCAQECNTDKDQIQVTVAKLDFIISNIKKGVSFCYRFFFFVSMILIYTISSLNFMCFCIFITFVG